MGLPRGSKGCSGDCGAAVRLLWGCSGAALGLLWRGGGADEGLPRDFGGKGGFGFEVGLTWGCGTSCYETAVGLEELLWDCWGAASGLRWGCCRVAEGSCCGGAVGVIWGPRGGRL